MKKIFLIITVCLLFLTVSGTAYGVVPVDNTVPLRDTVKNKIHKNSTNTISAETNNNDNLIMPQSDVITTIVQKKTEMLNKKAASLQKRAGEEIARRIGSLNSLIERIQKITKLNESQKSILTGNIQAEIENLNTLNTKIQNETDAQTLRDDVKSIISSYRIYLLFMPVSHIIITADGITNSADKLNELAGKLETRIAEVDEKDQKPLTTLLEDMKAKIADAKTQALSAIDSVNLLQPTDYPGNKQSLQKARNMLQTAVKDLITARQDAQKIIVALRKLSKNNTPTPTAEVVNALDQATDDSSSAR